MANRKNMNRRQFIKHTAGAAIGGIAIPYIIPSFVLGKSNGVAPGNKITVGCVGVGNQGRGDTRSFMEESDAHVVAVCDVDTNHLRSAKEDVDRKYGNKDCATYHDFRDLVARNDIDVVQITTPDHWHALVAIAAAKAGKDMYGEKPFAHSLREGRAACDAIKRYGRVFQYGTQQRGSRRCAFGCELVVNGRVGEIKEIHVEAPSGFGGGGSTKPIPVPEGLDYDTWLGPAPWSPYTKDRCINDGSWFVYNNSIGFLGGWGAHSLDIMHWAYPQIPVEYEGTGKIPTEGLYDVVDKWDVHGRFANGVKFTFKGMFPDETKIDTDKTTFVGEDGRVAVSRAVIDAHPKSLLTSIIKPDEIHLFQGRGHYQNFIDAIKTRSDAESPIDSAVQSDFISHLSDIAIRTGRKITWDPKKEEIIGDNVASRILTRPMRSPWHL